MAMRSSSWSACGQIRMAANTSGGIGLHATRIAPGDGTVSLTCLGCSQAGPSDPPDYRGPVVLVIAGAVWVAGADGIRNPIHVGQGPTGPRAWVRTSGTDTSLTALAVEGFSCGFELERS
jgi:hypothetical protein